METSKSNIKKGDIYQLGDHYLGCGSSTDVEFVAKVVEAAGASKKVSMVLTDPPYGVAYVEGKKFLKQSENHKEHKIIDNDHIQSEEQYTQFTVAWIDAIKEHLSQYNAIYIFGADNMLRAMRNGMDYSNCFYSQMLIWIKNTVVPGRKDYLPMHEIIVYGWYGKHKMKRSKAKSVLFANKPSRAALHPTMKPVELLRKIIPNSAKVGEFVYDAFGGSGSTLIACEHMKRRAILVELDPEYVATIIRRWETLTGERAKRL